MAVLEGCRNNKHNECVRQFQRFFIDPKTNKVVWLDEYIVCKCSKRGCECFVKASERKAKRK